MNLYDSAAKQYSTEHIYVLLGRIVYLLHPRKDPYLNSLGLYACGARKINCKSKFLLT